MAQVRAGTLTSSQVVNTLSGSMTNSAFVQQVVLNAYGRPATAAELTQYTNQLNSSTAANPEW